MFIFLSAIEVACKEKGEDLEELFSLANSSFLPICQEYKGKDSLNGGQEIYPPQGKME